MSEREGKGKKKGRKENENGEKKMKGILKVR